MMLSASGKISTLVATLWLSFASFGIGSSLPNPELPSLDGSPRSFLAKDRVTVFVFFDPEQAQSQDLLSGLAILGKKLSDQPVQWTGVLSERFAQEGAEKALGKAELDLATVVDEGDALYGELGVRLYPSVGVSSKEGSLLAYLPYQKVNYLEAIEAHTRHALGEIDQAELEAALRPTRVEFGGNGDVAKRNLRLAKMLFDAGKLDKALAKASEAVGLAPDSAPALSLLGAIQAGLQDCESAKASVAKALEIDPNDEQAKTALASCS